MHSRHARVVFHFLSIVCLAALAHADEASARKRLADHGILVTRAGLSLKDEAKLTKAFGEAAALKRKFAAARKSFSEIEREDAQSKGAYEALLEQSVNLSKQLKNTPQSNLVFYNSLITELNAINGELNLMTKRQERRQKAMDEAHKRVSAALEAYAQKILDMRTLADGIAVKYRDLANDENAKSALSEWNEAAKTSFEIAPSRAFRSQLKRLETLEKTAVPEKIALRRHGSVLTTDVVVNGTHTLEMIVDTGAGTLCLPHATAIECGVNLNAARAGRFKIADGSVVSGKIAKLDSVRVGKRTEKNVECGILPPGNDAMPLLGLTYLGRFKV